MWKKFRTHIFIMMSQLFYEAGSQGYTRRIAVVCSLIFVVEIDVLPAEIHQVSLSTGVSFSTVHINDMNLTHTFK